MPVNTINAPVYAAAMPALSRLNDDPARYRAVFGQVMQKLALLTMPAFALAAVTADWVVQILLGPSWEKAIPLVALFSVSAIYLPVLLAVGLLYMSQARTGEMLRATLIDAGFCVAAIVTGLQWGVIGVAAALAMVGLVIRTPVGFWLAARRGPVRAIQIWRAIAPPASAAVAVAVAVCLVRRVEPQPTLTGIVAVGATSLLVTVLVLLGWPETRRELLAIMSLPARHLRPT